jgi:thiol:disulfide interchange protein DsbD
MTRGLVFATLVACAADAEPHHPTMTYVGAEWCAACRVLERDTLPDREVTAELARFAVVRLDADVDDTRELGVTALPTLVLRASDGSMSRIVGTISPHDLASRLRTIR